MHCSLWPVKIFSICNNFGNWQWFKFRLIIFLNSWSTAWSVESETLSSVHVMISQRAAFETFLTGPILLRFLVGIWLPQGALVSTTKDHSLEYATLSSGLDYALNCRWLCRLNLGNRPNDSGTRLLAIKLTQSITLRSVTQRASGDWTKLRLFSTSSKQDPEFFFVSVGNRIVKTIWHHYDPPHIESLVPLFAFCSIFNACWYIVTVLIA